MTDQVGNRNINVTIIGGHGKIALLAAPLLSEQGHLVRSVIRKEQQSADVETAGAVPVVADVQELSVEELTELFSGQDVIVWAAGAGGGDRARTYAVDRDAAIRSMTAAEQAGAKRYIMVSWMGSVKNHGVPESEDFFSYADAKVQADEHLMGTDLDWTILGPSVLTTEPGNGKVEIVAFDEQQDRQGQASRENVANAIVAAIHGHGLHRFARFNDGDEPVAGALDAALKDTRL